MAVGKIYFSWNTKQKKTKKTKKTKPKSNKEEEKEKKKPGRTFDKRSRQSLGNWTQSNHWDRNHKNEVTGVIKWCCFHWAKSLKQLGCVGC